MGILNSSLDAVACQTFPVASLDFEEAHWEPLVDVMSVVTILNTASVGLSVEFPDWRGWFAVNLRFAITFVAELCVNLWFFGVDEFFCGKRWKWSAFDVVLAMTSVMEVCAPLGADTDHLSIFSFFSFVRILRVSRFARWAKIPVFKDLFAMMTGIIGGMRMMVWSLLLVMLPIYSVACLLRDTMKDQNVDIIFSTLPWTLFTLWRCFVGGDCSTLSGQPAFALLTHDKHWIYGLIYGIVLFVMTFGFFNVIVGLWVENTLHAAKMNDVVRRRQRLADKAYLSKKMAELVSLIVDHRALGDTRATKNVDLIITYTSFREIAQDSRVQRLFTELDLPDVDVTDLFDVLNADGRQYLTLKDLVVGLPKLRGTATRTEIVHNGLMLRAMQETLRDMSCIMSQGSRSFPAVRGT